MLMKPFANPKEHEIAIKAAFGRNSNINDDGIALIGKCSLGSSDKEDC